MPNEAVNLPIGDECVVLGIPVSPVVNHLRIAPVAPRRIVRLCEWWNPQTIEAAGCFARLSDLHAACTEDVLAKSESRRAEHVGMRAACCRHRIRSRARPLSAYDHYSPQQAASPKAAARLHQSMVLRTPPCKASPFRISSSSSSGPLNKFHKNRDFSITLLCPKLEKSSKLPHPFPNVNTLLGPKQLRGHCPAGSFDALKSPPACV